MQNYFKMKKTTKRFDLKKKEWNQSQLLNELQRTIQCLNASIWIFLVFMNEPVILYEFENQV